MFWTPLTDCATLPVLKRLVLPYDEERCRDMLQITVLSYFGFDRTAFGYAPKRNKKWWHWINDEKLKDSDIETI